VARCEAKAKEGAAFSYGLWDGAERKPVMQSGETLDQCADGKYRTYDLGVHPLRPGMYFWVAPPENAEAVQAVYVDRVFWVREK
jgi:hypothetical protein